MLIFETNDETGKALSKLYDFAREEGYKKGYAKGFDDGYNIGREDMKSEVIGKLEALRKRLNGHD